MPSGNGARAAQKRERNAKKADDAGHSTTAEDRKKQQAAATAYKCTNCMQTFSSTVRQSELEGHIEKHSKLKLSLTDCFPNWTGQA